MLSLPYTVIVSVGSNSFKGSVGQQSPTKRAIVTLVEGHTIDVTTGL